jgi:hypothetical protein
VVFAPDATVRLVNAIDELVHGCLGFLLFEGAGEVLGEGAGRHQLMSSFVDAGCEQTVDALDFARLIGRFLFVWHSRGECSREESFAVAVGCRTRGGERARRVVHRWAAGGGTLGADRVAAMRSQAASAAGTM